MRDPRRALVLGSGGLTGLAWEVGVLHGLAGAGVDLASDLVVGTSAGALLGARLASGATVDELAAALLADPLRSAELDEGPRQADPRSHSPFPERRAFLIPLLAAQFHPDRQRALVWLGRRAANEWTPERQAAWLDAVAGDLADRPWPTSLVVVATDATSGRPVFLRARHAADLAAAVAATCALPGVFPAVRVGERLLFDGGLRSPANLDVAGPADLVLALAPLTGAVRAQRRPAVQAARLRAVGTRVVLLTPDATGRRAIGVDVLAAGRVPAAFETGRALGVRRAAEVRAAWC